MPLVVATTVAGEFIPALPSGWGTTPDLAFEQNIVSYAKQFLKRKLLKI